ncbi:DUF6431 domain-containing protein [Desulforudis sp. Tu-874]|uniref:DUF6431 domain-containing protein n=1 Tax=Desulforudis sp. Tu-874 TaxID=3416276 RepID=UPI003CE46B21
MTRFAIYKVPVYRWYCPRCKKTVSLLPDFLVPYGRFINIVREKAVRLVVGGKTKSQVVLRVSSPAVSVISTAYGKATSIAMAAIPWRKRKQWPVVSSQ